MLIKLIPTRYDEREKFIKNIQAAFKKAVIEVYGDDGKEIVLREDLIRAFNEKGAEVLNIVSEGKVVGGAVIKINYETNRNELAFFYVNVDCHNKGIGSAAWCAIEKLHPETKIWETTTPYFEKRNIHFYVNKCGFHAVEFFNSHHKERDFDGYEGGGEIPDGDCFFRFEKVMRQ